MVFYRKYRPQTLEDLDSTAVREKLFAVLAKPDNIPHAFLFTGPKGLGKTSTARIIAKVVNCIGDSKNRGTSKIEPCNACDQCISITNGSNLDVLEIDAASNRGIDEIRELKETITLAPIQSKKKVYIIDEVHMLTTEAFNALLKTLEEPPSHAVFILCTTEPQKVPPTILSRTFHSHFQKATKDELIRSFKRITKGENMAVTDEALAIIASLSDGGFRDGTKLLEEVASLSQGKEITAEMIDVKYHTQGTRLYGIALIEAIMSQNVKEGLTTVSKIVADGLHVSFFLEEIITVLHTELLRKSGVETSDEEVPVLKDLSIPEVKLLLEVMTKALLETKTAQIKQLPLELAIIELTLPEEAQTESGATAEVTVSAQVDTSRVSVASLRKQIGNVRKNQALYGEEKKGETKKEVVPPANVSVLHFSAKGEITPEWLQDFWTCIIREVKEHNHTLAGVLRGCMIKSFDRKELVIETAYTFHREKLDNSTTKDVLESIAKNLTGNPVTVTIELKAG